MDWEVYPRALYNVLKRIQADYNPPAMYITENGAAYDDVLTPMVKVHDEQAHRLLPVASGSLPAGD